MDSESYLENLVTLLVKFFFFNQLHWQPEAAAHTLKIWILPRKYLSISFVEDLW